MSTKEKLIERFKKHPTDFTFDELVSLLARFGFEMSNKGKTSGSRVRFINDSIKVSITLHKPHKSGLPLQEATLKEIHEILILNNLI